MPARFCPNCQCENPVGAPFCMRCGTLLACLALPDADLSDTGIIEPEPAAVDARPTTEELLKRVVTEAGFEHHKTRAGYRVTVPLTEGRHQHVHVMFNGHDDDGHDVISFLSICGPADERQAMPLLRFNGKLTYAAFAVRVIGGKDHIVVTANQPAATADPAEIRKFLVAVAKHADAVEKKIGKGQDVY
ncbi:MAG TPA: zinc-ribbon domain-containing protein [Phycisphaerae bacterium]|nr:zinc-ribbon domain-containing protein [Phycisphaerae bacterium]